VIGPSWQPNFWDWTYAYEMGGADWLLDMVYTSDNQLFESTILSHSKGIVGKYLGGLCNRCTGQTNDPSYCLDALASLGAAGTFVWSVPISQSWYEDLKAYIGGGGKSPPPPPPPPPSSIPEFYAVKSGDTVYKISQAFGVSISEIMALNPQIPRAQTTWSAYLIWPGEPIEIKSPGDADPSAIYIAVKGDYVYKIAQNYKLTLSELLALNPQIPSAMKTVQAYEIWVNEIVRLRQ
jgi:LysM repeat protein